MGEIPATTTHGLLVLLYLGQGSGPSSRLLDVCAGNRFGDMYNPQHAPALCHESLRRLTAALPPSSTPPRGLRWTPRFQGVNPVHVYLGSGAPSTLPRRAPLSLPDAPAFQVVRERWHVSGGSAANGVSPQNAPEQISDAIPPGHWRWPLALSPLFSTSFFLVFPTTRGARGEEGGR
ncbi:hypothetical protein CSOJ01_07116 [Colletotrichum sojae]|uniref:Uncharacterized protein n=1 Tax=Colletotrichum sojae TaxID=2175907 RepID=A0A8H6J9P3_9PEZI|nr:hypothetical protein CSOJ01_07116 [Colletotrichum sojae]